MKESIHSGHRQRMKEKLMNNKSKQMLEHELLEVLLYYVQPRKNTNETAHLLLNEFGTIQKVFDADSKDLVSVNGVSNNICAFIKLFPELFEMYNKAQNAPLTNVSSTRQLKNYVEPILKNAVNETLYIIYIDEKGDAFAYEPLTKGNAVQIQSSMGEILSSIQRKSPKAIALAHNHPYGSCLPSEEDVVSTVKIKYMLKILGIDVYEHIILGVDGYCGIIDLVNQEYDNMMKGIELYTKNYRNSHLITIYKDEN